MIVGVPKETYPGERRVAVTPGVVPALDKAGLEVVVEPGAGAEAGFPDDQYLEQGARVARGRVDLFAQSDVILQVRGLGANREAGREDLDYLSEGQTVIGMLEPLTEPAAMLELAERGITAFAMELMPRITRAQSMDALSAMATIAGYKAALLAADHLPKMFPMLMTAAGTIKPAKVFVIGAGVAGLQAIATARRLGAVVEGYDVRPVAREQVESVGARFIELPLEAAEAEAKGGYARAMDAEFYRKQGELMMKVVAGSDVVITTAAVPGMRAPVLVTAAMVRAMSPGSVIVDLAAERGGNCELTRAGETVVEGGVTILGPLNLPATIPYHASQMYGRNISAFLKLLTKDGKLALDVEDEIIRESMVIRDGVIVNPRVKEKVEAERAAEAKEAEGTREAEAGGETEA